MPPLREPPTLLRSILTGAGAGIAMATLTAMIFGGGFFFALAFSIVPATLAGAALGLFARSFQSTLVKRRLALWFAGPVAVFAAAVLMNCGIALFGGLHPVPRDPILTTFPEIFFVAAGLTVIAMPGAIAGALFLEWALRGDARDAAARRLEESLRAADAQSGALAEGSLDSPSAEVRSVALAWIAEHHPQALRVLLAFLLRAPDEDLGAIAAALRVVSRRSAVAASELEPAFLQIFERGSLAAARTAAEFLGVVGGPAAASALQASVEIGYLAEECGAALRQIRPRLPNAGPGQLSEPSDFAGAGALSVPAKKGSLSF